MDGKNIVTVHPDALHTVADGTGHYTITSIVLTAGGGDSVAVVATTGEREREEGRGREGEDENEYIEVHKQFVGRKPNTSYSATRTGKEAFRKHLDALEQLLKMNK